METVSVSRTIRAPEAPIRQAMHEIGPFMEAAGFDRVTVDGHRFTIENDVGLLSISLTLQTIDHEAALAYEQIDGIFKNMVTWYTIESHDGETTVEATTEFELDASIVGPILDSTIISRQRKKELERQFDYLEDVAREQST